MSKKLSATRLFTILYFVPMFLVIALFVYWQVTTIKKFHHLELLNFFNQTKSIVNIIIKEKKEHITYTLEADRYNLSRVDFTFLAKNGVINDIHGFSLLVDVKKLSQELLHVNNLDSIVSVEIDKTIYYLLAQKKQQIDNKFGKVTGEVWGVVILNNNTFLANEIKNFAKLDDFILKDKTGNSIASTLPIEQTQNIIQNQKDKNLLINRDKNLITAQKSLYENNQIGLYSIFVTNNIKYNKLIEVYYKKAGLTIVALTILGILFFFFIKYIFIDSLKKLENFISDTLNGRKKIYKTNIKELNDISKNFENLFLNLNKQQLVNEERLQKLVDTKTDEIIKQKEMMQQQSKLASMGEMIGAIAHQWRQPLNSLAIHVQNLDDDFEDGLVDEKFINEFIDDNMKTINFMSHTIDDFRNFFRVDKKRSSFSAKKAINSVLKIQSSMLEKSDITINMFNGDLVVSGYESEFKQVILNLINNAKDALVENHTVEAQINISFEHNKILINDNAGGIPQKIMDRIFEPYFTTKEQGKGTGMGLYMSKMIIEDNMQGSLHVSNVNHGAKFTIEF